MIAPLAPMAIKGAIWYQGEGNARQPFIYRHVLAALIKDWRDAFNQGNLPFFIVELAPYGLKNDPELEWAIVRESQQWAAKNVPNVESISIVDVGDENDLHPPKKQPVGSRLAIAARGLAYGEKITYDGPEFDSVKFENGRAVVSFKNVGKGLVAKDGELTDFTIAGDDQKFHPAVAKIDGATVVVTSDVVKQPKSVRYGWANVPRINLWNQDGLPAHPFRTDDWPVKWQDAK
jgi:sialate O-acetylesterase